MDELSSQAGPSSGMMEPKIEQLVLDAGPLLTQQRLRGLAKKYYITSNVVAELRDKRARDHFDWLRSEAGGALDIEVCDANPEAKLAVIAFAKQTGDYSVLSLPDLSVLALTYALETKKHGMWRIRDSMGGLTGQQKHTKESQKDHKTDVETKPHNKASSKSREAESGSQVAGEAKASDVKAEVSIDELTESVENGMSAVTLADDEVAQDSFRTADDDVDDEETDSEDDEETGGEWINPDNIDKHKSLALGLVTDTTTSSFGVPTTKTKSNGRLRPAIEEGQDGWATVTTKNTVEQRTGRGSKKQDALDRTSKKPQPKLTVACMTGDYAVQNVLLQIGLSLVSLEGHRIHQVKAWVLRCHACFKICKDSERKFCPQCGNATLMRTSVTSTGSQQNNGGSPSNGLQVHLRKNFQYKNRGTKYPLPLPKAGKAAGAAASVPILREDQPEWQRAVQREKIQRSKEERALNTALERGSDSISARYEDTDSLSILLAGGKNSGRHQQGLPELGIGRLNPNERRRKKV